MKYLIAIVLLFVISSTPVDAAQCTHITVGWSTITDKIKVTATTPIKYVRMWGSRGMDIGPVSIQGNEAYFKASRNGLSNYRVDIEVEDQCQTWQTYMEPFRSN